MSKICVHIGKGMTRRITALLLAMIMVATISPPVTAAGVTDSGKVLLSDFAELPENIRRQSVPLGVSLGELNLPDTLTATVGVASVDADPEEPKDSGAATLPTEEQPTLGTSDVPASKAEIIEENDVPLAEEAPLAASPSDAQDKADPDAGAEKTVIISGITWESDPLYDSETEGTYTFTAVLPSGYTVEDGIAMPEITVTVKSAVDAVIAMIDALPTMDEWTAMDDAAARAAMDEILAAKKAYDALTAEEKAQVDETRTAKLLELAEMAEQLAGIMPMVDNVDLRFTEDSPSVSGAGYAWVKDAKTLTLNGYTSTSGGCTGIQLPDGATLVIDGTNSIIVTGAQGIASNASHVGNDGILCGSYGDPYNTATLGALTIEGNGTLAVSCAYTGPQDMVSSWGMRATSIIMNGSTVTCTGNKANDSYGVLVEDAITINGGSLSGTGEKNNESSNGSYGVYTATGNITVTSGGALKGTGSTGVMMNELTVDGGSVVGVGKGDTSQNMGVAVNNDLTINSGTITSTAEDCSDMSAGVGVVNTFTVNGGIITATSGTAAMSSAVMSVNLPTLGTGMVTKCNIGGNTGYTDEANFAMNDDMDMYVVYEGDTQDTSATDVKICKALPPGLLDDPLTQEKVDRAFGAGNATLAGSTITLNNSIVVNNTIIFDGVTATLDLNGKSITGARGADSATTAGTGIDAAWLQNNANVTVDGTKAGSAIIGGRGGDHTNNGSGGGGGMAVGCASEDNTPVQLTMKGGELIGGDGGYTDKPSKGGSGGTSLYVSNATVTLNGVTVRGGGIADYVDGTGGDALDLYDGTFSLTDVTAIGGKGSSIRVSGTGVYLQSETASLTIDGGRYVGHLGLDIYYAASTVKILAGEFKTSRNDDYYTRGSIRQFEDVPVGDLFDLSVPEGHDPKVLLLDGIEVTPADLTESQYTETIQLIKNPEPAVMVVLNGTEKYYYDFAAAWAAATGDGNTSSATVQLLSDMNQKQYFLNNNAPITVPQDKTVTLDLNGFAIDRELTEPTGDGSVIVVDGGTLTLDDTSTAKTGKVTGGYSDYYGGGVLVRGNFILQGGTITGNRAYMGSGVATQTGSAVLKGGAITGNQNYLDPYSPVNYGSGLYVSILAALESGGYVPVPTVKLSGGITIDGNTDANGKPSNVALELMPGDASGGVSPDDDVASTLIIDGALTGKIGVALMELDENLDATSAMGTVASADPLYHTGTIPASDATRFASDIPAFGTGISADSKTLLLMDADRAAVAAAKAAIVDGSVNVAFDATQADKTAAVQTYVNSLITGNAAGVTATVTYNSGTGKYDVALSKGSVTDSKTITMTVNESTDPDLATVTAAKTAAENATYTATTQAATGTESAAQAYVQNIATTAVNNSGVTVTVDKVSYTAPVAGTSSDRDGTNGSYIFTITVSKGSQSQTTKLITIAITATAYSGSTGGDGGGGGSTGGGTTTPPTSKPTEPVTGNTENKATVDDKGNANVSISDKNITDAIANAKAEADKTGVNAGEITAVINVTTGGKDATTVSVNLPKVVQEQVIDSKIAKVELVIDRPDLTIGMNLSAVTEINKQANADVQISASKTNAATLSADAQAAIGNRPAYDLKATYQSGGKSVTNFGAGTVSIEIPYKLQSGENAGNIYAVYVDGNGKVTYLTSSSYDAKRETLVFTTNHFSVYGVGFKATSSKFTDTADHWAKDSIDFVVSRGLMNGTSATTFSPNDAMTRGMFVTTLGRLSGVDVSGYKASSFSDVAADAYYMGYIEWANKNNIVVGIGGGKFAPDTLVTREQMAVIMDRYATAIGFKLPEVHVANTFADNTKIGGWSAESVKRIQMAGIITGKTGNVFDPQGTATRAEVSAVVKRFVELAAFSNTAQGWTMNDSGKWMYYENGKPVTGTKNIDGTTYTFNSYGEIADTPKKLTYGAYTVKKGDSWWKIAREQNCNMYELARVNGKTIFSFIYEGDVLKVPQQ